MQALGGGHASPRWGGCRHVHTGFTERLRFELRSRSAHPCGWARGDGPWTLGLVSTANRAAPCTRGWTPRGCAVRHGRPGCPAHAGMDRHRIDQADRRRRLPRARGDGPHQIASGKKCRRLPRARGDGPRSGWLPARRERRADDDVDDRVLPVGGLPGQRPGVGVGGDRLRQRRAEPDAGRAGGDGDGRVDGDVGGGDAGRADRRAGHRRVRVGVQGRRAVGRRGQ